MDKPELKLYLMEIHRVLDTEYRVLQNSVLCQVYRARTRYSVSRTRYCTLLKLKADYKFKSVHAPRRQFCRTSCLCAKGTNPHLRNRLSFNKRRWPLPQVRQGKMEGAFLRQDFPLVHAELCSGGSMAESLTRSHLIGRAWSMAEEWAAQGLACGADATAVELEVCELLEIYPPGAGTWEPLSD